MLLRAGRGPCVLYRSIGSKSSLISIASASPSICSWKSSPISSGGLPQGPSTERPQRLTQFSYSNLFLLRKFTFLGCTTVIGPKGRQRGATRRDSEASMAIQTTSNTQLMGLIEVERVSNGLGTITINRPRALNAMNTDMVEAHRAALRAFWRSPNIGAVLVSGSEARAFCSGGDIKSIREAVLQKPFSGTPPRQHPGARVFQAEYNLVCDITNSSLPYIALCDGVWMGLGVGIAAHGDVRIVTEKTLFAMPENAIGLWPDVGFALLAARAPGAVGLYLALTGERLSTPADLLHAQLATHYVHSERVAQLRLELQQTALPQQASKEAGLEAVLEIVQQYAEDAPAPCRLALLESHIDEAFGAAQRAVIGGEPPAGALAALRGTLLAQAESADEAVRQYACGAVEGLNRGAPLSLAVTLRHFAEVAKAVRGGGGPLAGVEGVMQQELGLAVRLVGLPDFAEGVRAALVDKDRNPAWKPAALDGVTDDALNSLFKPLPDEEQLRPDYYLHD